MNFNNESEKGLIISALYTAIQSKVDTEINKFKYRMPSAMVQSWIQYLEELDPDFIPFIKTQKSLYDKNK